MVKLVIGFGVLALLASGVMLPWAESSVRYQYIEPRYYARGSIEHVEQVPTRGWGGYHPVSNAPQGYVTYNDDGKITRTVDFAIDRDRLLLEWLLIALITVGTVLLFAAAKGQIGTSHFTGWRRSQEKAQSAQVAAAEDGPAKPITRHLPVSTGTSRPP